MSGNETNQFGQDALGELVRHAGRGPVLSMEARERIYQATRRQWESVVDHERRSAAPSSRQGRRWFVAAALAAGIGAVALIGFNVLQTTTAPAALFARVTAVEGVAGIDRDGATTRVGADSATLVRVGDRLETDANGRLAMELPNGQRLRVGADTELTVADAGSIELETGTVYFDSAADVPSAAFMIRTRFGLVRHIGTQYQADVGEGRLRVKVREGAASVEHATGALVARAGEDLAVGQAGELARGTIAPDDPAWRWVEDLAIMRPPAEQTLLEALEWAGREMGLHVSFVDAATQTRAASVMLYELAGLDPREVLEVIRSTTQFRLEQANGELIVSAP